MRRSLTLTLVVVGFTALAGAALLFFTNPPHADRMIVYCAAGVRPAVEPILRRYEQEQGAARGSLASLQVGPSGWLEAQTRVSQRGELFLPAAVDPFLCRLQDEGFVEEVLPVASMRLVIAFAPGRAPNAGSIEALIAEGVPFGVCNQQAAAGQRTAEALRAAGLWERASAAATATLPTVTELAEAVRDGGRLGAGVVWRTTALQFGLQVVDADELRDATSSIGVGVLRSARDKPAARRLAEYIASPLTGRPEFARLHYDVQSNADATDANRMGKAADSNDPP